MRTVLKERKNQMNCSACFIILVYLHRKKKYTSTILLFTFFAPLCNLWKWSSNAVQLQSALGCTYTCAAIVEFPWRGRGQQKRSAAFWDEDIRMEAKKKKQAGQEVQVDLWETKEEFSVGLWFCSAGALIGLMFLQRTRSPAVWGEGEMFVQERSHVSPGWDCSWATAVFLLSIYKVRRCPKHRQRSFARG